MIPISLIMAPTFYVPERPRASEIEQHFGDELKAASRPSVECMMANEARTPGERWEQGIPHDPRSVSLFKSIMKLDWDLNSDYFGWKVGGDGDNGEVLMYLLDEHFQREDEATSPTSQDHS